MPEENEEIIYEDINEDDIEVTPSADDITLDNVFYGQTLRGGKLSDSEIDAGSKNKRFKFEQDKGIWLGNSDFDNAPFSVDMDGNLFAQEGTFGGELESGIEIEAPVITGGEIYGSYFKVGEDEKWVEINDTSDAIKLGYDDIEKTVFQTDVDAIIGDYGLVLESGLDQNGFTKIQMESSDAEDYSEIRIQAENDSGDKSSASVFQRGVVFDCNYGSRSLYIQLDPFNNNRVDVQMDGDTVLGLSDSKLGVGIYGTSIDLDIGGDLDVSGESNFNDNIFMNGNNVEDIATVSTQSGGAVTTDDLYINLTDEVKVDGDGYLYID